MAERLENTIDLVRAPLHQQDFRIACKHALDTEGVLVMHGFLKPNTIKSIRLEGQANRHLAYFTANNHNICLSPPDPNYLANHPRNREVVSSKGCITTDQIPANSALRTLYYALEFRDFLCAVLGQDALHEFADPLSSINLHFAHQGHELGWHLDNSAFAITLMIQEPQRGGVFEYVRDVRHGHNGEINFELAEKILNGQVAPNSLSMGAGALVLFRGQNCLHRVTPVQGSISRILAVLAYNAAPGICLSESARMTFFGRI